MTCTTSDIYVNAKNKKIKLATTWGHLACKLPNHCPLGMGLRYRRATSRCDWLDRRCCVMTGKKERKK